MVKDSNDAVTVHDFEGNITDWNKGAEKMYGYSEDEALKMIVCDIVPEDHRKIALAFIKKLREEYVESFETQRVIKNGKRLNVWIAVTRLADEDGRPIAIATAEHDISERKQEKESAHKA